MAATQQTTGFNVSGFTSTIKTLGLANPNKFKVDIVFPKSLGVQGSKAMPEQPDNQTLQELNLMVETVSFSGRGVQTVLDLQ